MDYGKTFSLASATTTMGGVLINQLWLAVVAGGLIIVAAIMIRVAWRRGKKASQP